MLSLLLLLEIRAISGRCGVQGKITFCALLSPRFFLSYRWELTASRAAVVGETIQSLSVKDSAVMFPE